MLPDFTRLNEIPTTRVPIGDPGFWKHLKECKDGNCRRILLGVEIPLRARWLFLVGAGFFFSLGEWVPSLLCLALFIALDQTGKAVGRLLTVIITIREREEMMSKMGDLMGNLKRAMGLGDGKITPVKNGMMVEFTVPKGDQQEPEDPIEKILRESREQYEKNLKDKKNNPNVS